MKAFHLIPTSSIYGYLYDDSGMSPAIFLTPGQAKFQATFQTIREHMDAVANELAGAHKEGGPGGV